MTSPLTLAVRAATTAALPTCVYDARSRTLTASSNGAIGSLDGVAVQIDDLELIQNQTDKTTNGVYVWRALGGASAKWQLQRSSDFCSSLQLQAGVVITVAEGTTYGGTIRRLKTAAPITLDHTNLEFDGATTGGSGDVTGPGSAVSDNIAQFSGATGKVISDSGIAAGDVALGITAAFGAAQKADNLSDLASASTARTNLGLGGAAVLSVGTAAGTVAAGDDSRITGALQASNNLSDIAKATTARSNLGLGGAAVLNVGLASGTVAAGNDLRLGFFRARLATTAALPACTYSSGVLTASANGALTVDSKAVNASDLILVYQQVTATQNGLYTVTATGSAGTPWVLTRSAALNATAQWTNGLMFYAWDGTATTGNLRKWFVCTNTGAITLDSTNLTFAEAFLSSLSTASAIYESGGTTLSIASIADGEILYRTGSTIDGIASGVSGGVALYADERFDNLTDTINFMTANSGATDLTGNGIFQGITGSGGGSNGTSRYGRYRRNTTGTVSGDGRYQSNTVTDAYLAMGPRLTFKQAISRTTNIRAFVGYSTTSAPQGMSADDTAGATIGFQYSTPRGDTSIQFIWDDGTTQGTDSTGVSFTADVPLVFVIDWDRVNAKVTGRIYSTSGSAWSQVYSRTQTTGLPAGSTSFYIGAGVQTQAASAVYIDTYYWNAKIRGL